MNGIQAGKTFATALLIGTCWLGSQARCDATPLNDNFSNAQALPSSLSGTVTGSNTGATAEPNEPDPGYSSGKSVWYRWTAPASGGVTFTTAGSNFNNVLRVYSGSSVDHLTNQSQFASGDGTHADSVTVNAVSGATYSVLVDDDQEAGSIKLSWSAGPPNDNFANAITIPSAQTGSVIGSNVGASAESNEPDPGYANGRSVWFRWTAPESGGITFTTAGSDFNNVLRVYSGSSVDHLTNQSQFASGDGTHGDSVTVDAQSGATYSILVDDDQEVGNIKLSWQPGPANDDFANAQTVDGITVDVSGTNVGASTEPNEPDPGYANGRSVWYAWVAPSSGTAFFSTKSNFANVLRAYTGDSVDHLTNVTAAEVGDGSSADTIKFATIKSTTYYLLIDDSQSNTGNFSLFGGLPPANDNFANAQILSGGSGSVTGINLPASSEPGEPNHSGIAGGSSVWYRWTAPASGTVSFNTDGSDFDTLLAAYTGSDVAHLTEVASDDNYPNGVNGSSQITFNALGGATYMIAVDGFGGATGHVTLTWSEAGAPVTNPNPTPSPMGGHQFAGGVGWQMIAAPYTYSQNFSDFGVTAYAWQPLPNQYAVTPVAPADTFRLGQGYWVYLDAPVTIPGGGSGANPFSPFTIPLDAGWNMVGNPFASPVTLGSMTVVRPDGTSTPFIGDTTTSPLYPYDPSTGNYVTLTDVNQTLDPWAGAWLYASQAESLVIAQAVPLAPPPAPR